MEIEKILLIVLIFFIFITLFGLSALINFSDSFSNSDLETSINKIPVSEIAPAALSGKWELIK